LNVQATVSGQTKEKHTGAVAAISPGGTQVIPISILPVSSGDAVPMSLSIEYEDEGGVPYMVVQSTSVAVARINQSVSPEARTLISIGEIINHAGTGDLYARSRRSSVAGDHVAGTKTGDVLSTRSSVGIGADTAGAGQPAERLCPACAAPVGGAAAFCSRCGETLATRCSSCGMDLHGAPRFCPGCGKQLAAT
jgi:hypothetical protein